MDPNDARDLDATIAQRIVQAKRKLRDNHASYRILRPAELPDRLNVVLAAIAVIFTEGHTATSGTELMRTDLSAEAIRLARVLVELMPDEPEAVGLLALMVLTDARRSARTDGDGSMVRLSDQDRSRWNHDLIARVTAWSGPASVAISTLGSRSRPPSPQSTPTPRLLTGPTGNRPRSPAKPAAEVPFLVAMTSCPASGSLDEPRSEVISGCGTRSSGLVVRVDSPWGQLRAHAAVSHAGTSGAQGTKLGVVGTG